MAFALSDLRLALDPVHDTQLVFRAVLEALARPGCNQQVPVAALDAPRNPWVAAVLLTLLDHETSFATVGDDTTERFVRARTGARPAAPAEADFVLVDGASLTPSLVLELRRGSLAYPDEGATLIVSIPASAAWSERRIGGPGIDGERPVLVPLDPCILDARDEANASYPRGIDLLLIDAAGGLVGLPRTTRIGRR
jgi:alpha-D-ribose 1-methylphosphonate 5-triphosphate synthase subunit PhnH